jgi:small subunit ribosomal protein S30e
MPTHGSVTKAGKVRSQTPIVEGKERTSPSPKKRNRKNYRKRFILKKNPGQGRRRR